MSNAMEKVQFVIDTKIMVKKRAKYTKLDLQTS